MGHAGHDRAISVVPHSRPTIEDRDVRAVASAVAGGMIAGGPDVADFEKNVAARIGTPYACATGSGTAAIHLALLALGVGPGDEVVLPAYLCAGPLFAVRYVGATPVLADVDHQTGIATSDQIKTVMTRRTRAVIVVHLFGRAAPVEKIVAMGVPVIEDCAQALGGQRGGRPLGSWGAVSVFSFYATKVITTGRGGMVCSGDEGIIGRVRDLMRYDERDDDSLAFPYAISAIQAALGNSQVSRLDAFIAERKNIYDRYYRSFADAGIVMPTPAAPKEDIHYRFVLKAPGRVHEIIARLSERGITARPPVYRPLTDYTGQRRPGAWEAHEEDVSIPIFPSLTNDEVGRVIETVIAAFGDKA